MASPDSQNIDPHGPEDLLSQAVFVPTRTVDSHRKAINFGPSSHETHSVAPEEPLACSRNLGEDHSSAKVSPSLSELVAG